MTTDLHDALDRARSAAPPSTLDLARLEGARARRTTRRKAGGLVVGMTLLLAIAAVAVELTGTSTQQQVAVPAGLQLDGRIWYREEFLLIPTADPRHPSDQCSLRFQGTRWIGRIGRRARMEEGSRQWTVPARSLPTAGRDHQGMCPSRASSRTPRSSRVRIRMRTRRWRGCQAIRTNWSITC